MEPTTKPRIAFFTLGCKLNFSESSYLSNLMMEDGFVKVDFEEQAEVYVINTCTVTAAADKKCRNMINRAVQKSPGALVVVTGCYARLAPSKIEKIPGVDLILAGNEKFNLRHYLNQIKKRTAPEVFSCSDAEETRFFPAFSLNDRTRSFLKIQDGCDYSCSYCTIPLARGHSRSASISSILSQVESIADSGVKEIVLTGVNTGDFGKTTGETFFELLTALDRVDGVERYRISSIEPNLLTQAMIEWIAGSFRFAPHFHIPLQSGSNKILALMKRRYQRELFAQKIETIRRISPLAFIGVDIIVGFPGETERDFEESYQFLQDLEVSELHVFSFSARPNTPAANFPDKVSAQEKNQRSKRLHQLSDKKKLSFYQRNIGTQGFVLFESQQDGLATGYSGNYLRVECLTEPNILNRIVPISFQGLTPEGMMSGFSAEK
jgi:threonylcarbamoyladenosine tRNA methylthiotransferase MtaB